MNNNEQGVVTAGAVWGGGIEGGTHRLSVKLKNSQNFVNLTGVPISDENISKHVLSRLASGRLIIAILQQCVHLRGGALDKPHHVRTGRPTVGC